MKPRAIHLVSAVLVGLGIGVMIYRFAILGLFWSGGAKWLFPAIATGLVAAGFTLQAKDTTSERPAMTTRIALAIVGIGAAMGLLYVLVPTLSRIALETRTVQGFSIDTPRAKPDVERGDYNTGTVMWKEVGGANAVISVSWQGGVASKEELEIGMNALAGQVGANGSPRTLEMPGPNNTKVDSMVIDTNKGVPLHLSLLPCGTRSVLVMTIGDAGIQTVHARMLTSFRCTPDATKEQSSPGIVRIALSLPGWWVSEKDMGQVTLTNDRALLIVREITQSDTKLEEVVVPLLNAFGGKMVAKPAVGDRIPFSGTLEGEQIEGWARRIVCQKHNLLLMAMSTDADGAEEAYVQSSNAGCLRDGETPPVWPERPADAPAAP